MAGLPTSGGHVTDSMCHFEYSGDQRVVLSRGMNGSDSGFLDCIPDAMKRMNWDFGGKGKAAGAKNENGEQAQGGEKLAGLAYVGGGVESPCC